MFKNLSFIIAALFPVAFASGQSGLVTGKVTAGDTKEVLPGANIYWSGSTTGTQSLEDGTYSIAISSSLPALLVVSYVGYLNDTISITGPGHYTVSLSTGGQIKPVDIEARQESTMISTINPLNVEEVGKKELLKAACCNLSESFETNPSVNLSYSDAITGAKEIQMLGLSGIYSQIMTENIPAVRGLASTYGLNYVPGPWMESIQITKGSGSVANGYESTTGQINVEYIKPETSEKVYLNLYGASSGNTEVNTHVLIPVKNSLNSVLFLHGENSPVEWDHQKDGFMDMPKVKQVNVFNRWSFNDGERYEGQFGIKALAENRKSGQTAFEEDRDQGTTNHYGVEVNTRRYEAFSKTGRIFPATPWKSAGIILSGSYHDQDSYFGLKTYDGKQLGFYSSFIFMSIIGTTDHKWKVGLDYRYDDYDEMYNGLEYLKKEEVPGVFGEYTYSYKDKVSVVAGGRADHHNDYGWFYTPRLHAKYNFTPEIIVRGSAGRSFRTANVFAENIGVMATSRELVIAEELDPERAWNYGANLTARFTIDYRPGSVSLDYYITDFTDQVIVDMYSSSDKILFYNLQGESSSKSFQVALNYEIFKRFDLRLAYKNDDVVTDYAGITSQKPLVAQHKALINMAYAARKEIWKFDFTVQYEGEKKLGLNDDNAHQGGHGDSQVKNNISPDFIVVNAQVTRKLNKWDIYFGVENLADFRQEMPVMGYENPFGADFDATNVWGPVMGRKLYLGVRFALQQDKKS
jgi:outer membrane receptor for ferrienterochelin and colicins